MKIEQGTTTEVYMTMTFLQAVERYFHSVEERLALGSLRWVDIMEGLCDELANKEFSDDLLYGLDIDVEHGDENSGMFNILHPDGKANNMAIQMIVDSMLPGFCRGLPPKYIRTYLPEGKNGPVEFWFHQDSPDDEGKDEDKMLLCAEKGLVTDIPHQDYMNYAVKLKIGANANTSFMAKDIENAKARATEIAEALKEILQSYEDCNYELDEIGVEIDDESLKVGISVETMTEGGEDE